MNSQRIRLLGRTFCVPIFLQKIIPDEYEYRDPNIPQVCGDDQLVFIVFRGLVATLTVFVTYGGGSYPKFQYSAWDGGNLADLTTPW